MKLTIGPNYKGLNMKRCLNCKHLKIEDLASFTKNRLTSNQSYETKLTCTNILKRNRHPNVIHKARIHNSQFNTLGSNCEDFEENT